jgi:hypothetical protein
LRCNVNLQEKAGFTPLHYATQEGHESVAEQLIAARCQVNLQTNSGYTPLHHAVHRGHAVITEQLLAARCDVDLQNKFDYTAQQLAELLGHTAIATLIRNKKQKDADRAMTDTLLQASPEKTNTQQEDAGRTEEDKYAVAAKALELYEKARARCEESGDRAQQAKICCVLADCNCSHAQCDKAIEMLEEARALCEELGNHDDLTNVIARLRHLYALL